MIISANADNIGTFVYVVKLLMLQKWRGTMIINMQTNIIKYGRINWRECGLTIYLIKEINPFILFIHFIVTEFFELVDISPEEIF